MSGDAATKYGLVGKTWDFVVFQAHQCPVTIRLAIDEWQSISMHAVPEQSLAARKSTVKKPHVLWRVAARPIPEKAPRSVESNSKTNTNIKKPHVLWRVPKRPTPLSEGAATKKP